jgi:hypothetical protein
MNNDLIKAGFVLCVMLAWFLSPWPFWRMVNAKSTDAAGAATVFVFLVSIFVAMKL